MLNDIRTTIFLTFCPESISYNATTTLPSMRTSQGRLVSTVFIRRLALVAASLAVSIRQVEVIACPREKSESRRASSHIYGWV
jgi:hypothetical protein